MNSATLKPVAQKGYWRVKLAWPDKHHFFGEFFSRAEAEKWIETTSLANRATLLARWHFAKQIERPLNLGMIGPKIGRPPDQIVI